MTAKEHEQELADLYTFFQTPKFPQMPLRLNKYMTLSDPNLFLQMEVMRIEKYQGSDIVRDSLFKHMRELKAIILNG